MPTKTTAAIVLNYRNPSDTLDCADSLLQCNPPPDWLIIVDNASPDDSLTAIRHWATTRAVICELHENALDCLEKDEGVSTKQLFLVSAESNRGYAAGNNLGLCLARFLGADSYLICNNDTVFCPDAILHLRMRLFSSHHPGLCGPTLRYFYQPDIIQCRAGGYTNIWTGLSRLNGQGMAVSDALAADVKEVETGLNFIYGACVMASREFVDAVGLMDEGYFLYCEEQDWAWSARGRFSLSYAPEAHVLHKEGSTTDWSRTKKNFQSLLRLTRSRFRLHARHAPHTLPTVSLSLGFAALRLVWRRLLEAVVMRLSRARN